MDTLFAIPVQYHSEIKPVNQHCPNHCRKLRKKHNKNSDDTGDHDDDDEDVVGGSESKVAIKRAFRNGTMLDKRLQVVTN